MSKAVSRAQLQAIVKTITKFYPAEYADSAWDNTGLLIDCSTEDAVIKGTPKVLLTVDLTQSVAQEAIEKNCNMVIAYHPFIFPSFKAIAPQFNPQHKSLLALVQNGISVYSPHTAVDAARGGVNDWLVNGIVGFKNELISKSVSVEKIRAAGDDETIGYGRLVTLEDEGIRLSDLVANIKKSLGLSQFQISSNYPSLKDKNVRIVALCAGSGSSVFKSLSRSEQDAVEVYYTGELSHHEILRLKELGKIVITCNHTNTERGYLQDVMAKNLQSDTLDVVVSETDHDPLIIV